jgi:erythronate-4-phosphate dehydrogenase
MSPPIGSGSAIWYIPENPTLMLIIADAKNALVNSAFQGLGDVQTLPTQEITRQALADAEVVIVRSETKVDADLLEGTNVRFVATATIGTDHIDLEYLKAREIGFANAPGRNANSVAEYIAAALLVLACAGRCNLEQSSIAVIGVGNVGSRVERIARGLGIKVLLNDPPLADSTGDPKYLPLDAVIDADIVSLHVPLTRGGRHPTYHFFGAERLESMKKGALLMNTSRGAVVETGALKSALRSAGLAGAVLDVWENEPFIDTALLSQCTLGTPHIAGYSLDGKVNAARIIFHAVREHFGLSASWELNLQLPGPETPRIVVEERPRNAGSLLQSVVRKCYDIQQDDHRLRELITLPEERRAERFRELRSGYQVRREFCNSTVELPAGHDDERRTLEVLGFTLL